MVERFGVFEVADVLAQKRMAAAAEREPGLLLRPEGKDTVRRGGQQQRLRRPAPAAAQKVRRALPQHRDRIIAAVLDRAVMQKEAVGDAVQRGEGFRVAGQHRAAGAVGAGQHKRVGPARRAVGQQRVQRGVGQQHAKAGGGAQEPPGVGVALLQQQDRPPRVLQPGGFRFVQCAERADGGKVAAEHGQRARRAVLAAAQAGDGGGAAGVAGQVDAAGPLDGDDTPGRQRALRQGDGVAGAAAARGVQVKRLRPARRAGVGLGVVAAVFNIFILGRAGRAHSKARHGGVGAVVGQRAQDGKARAAVGAVDERVAVAAVGGVGHFAQAGRTGGQVGRDERGRGPGRAGADGKAAVARRGGEVLGFDLLDNGERRGFAAQRLHKGGERRRLPFQLAFDPGGGVAHPARQRKTARQPVQERAEAHPLHNAVHLQAQAFHARAARMRAARCPASASSPAPVRLETSNCGASGLTPR